MVAPSLNSRRTHSGIGRAVSATAIEVGATGAGCASPNLIPRQENNGRISIKSGSLLRSYSNERSWSH
jgi:hypothetical protein